MSSCILTSAPLAQEYSSAPLISRRFSAGGRCCWFWDFRSVCLHWIASISAHTIRSKEVSKSPTSIYQGAISAISPLFPGTAISACMLMEHSQQRVPSQAMLSSSAGLPSRFEDYSSIESSSLDSLSEQTSCSWVLRCCPLESLPEFSTGPLQLTDSPSKRSSNWAPPASLSFPLKALTLCLSATFLWVYPSLLFFKWSGQTNPVCQDFKFCGLWRSAWEESATANLEDSCECKETRFGKKGFDLWAISWSSPWNERHWEAACGRVCGSWGAWSQCKSSRGVFYSSVIWLCWIKSSPISILWYGTSYCS